MNADEFKKRINLETDEYKYANQFVPEEVRKSEKIKRLKDKFNLHHGGKKKRKR